VNKATGTIRFESVETCTGTALELSANADTGFAMEDMNNSSFVKSEDWLNSAAPLFFKSVSFGVTA
jgi:hypothetical protein